MLRWELQYKQGLLIKKIATVIVYAQLSFFETPFISMATIASEFPEAYKSELAKIAQTRLTDDISTGRS